MSSGQFKMYSLSGISDNSENFAILYARSRWPAYLSPFLLGNPKELSQFVVLVTRTFSLKGELVVVCIFRCVEDLNHGEKFRNLLLTFLHCLLSLKWKVTKDTAWREFREFKTYKVTALHFQRNCRCCFCYKYLFWGAWVVVVECSTSCCHHQFWMTYSYGIWFPFAFKLKIC